MSYDIIAMVKNYYLLVLPLSLSFIARRKVLRESFIYFFFSFALQSIVVSPLRYIMHVHIHQ